jgi:hypothetical protein
VSDLFIRNDGTSEEGQRVRVPPLQISIGRPLHFNNGVGLSRLDPSKLTPMSESRSSQIPAATSEGGTVMEGTSEKTTPFHEDYPSPGSFGSNFAPLDGPAQRIDGLFQEDTAFSMFQSQSMVSNPSLDDNFLETATLDMWSSAPTSMVYVALIVLYFHPHSIFPRLNDWAIYLNDVNQLTHQQVQFPFQQPDHNDERPWDAGYMANMY